jgi:acetyl-CoA carboxylase biotin carboxyl carrier protein
MKRAHHTTKTSKAAAPAREDAPASAGSLEYRDILAIVRLIESGSRFSEFRLRSGDIEVDIKRANGASDAPPRAAAQPIAAAPAATSAPQALPDGHVIRSPMVGTFYRAPEPGAPAFVEVGAHVEPDTVVCIIEVMKLMNSVAAGVKGVVTHVLVENAHMVEYAQPLIAIRTE